MAILNAIKIVMNRIPTSSPTSKCSCKQLLLQRNSTRNMYFLKQRMFLYSVCVELTRKSTVLRGIGGESARELSDATAAFCCPWGSCFQTVKTTINTIPDKYLFHNEMAQFLLFYGENYFVIKLQKQSEMCQNCKGSFRGKFERK